MCRLDPMLRGTADRYGGTDYPIQSSWTIILCNAITFNHTRDRHSLAADRQAGLGSDGYEWYDNADALAHHLTQFEARGAAQRRGLCRPAVKSNG